MRALAAVLPPQALAWSSCCSHWGCHRNGAAFWVYPRVTTRVNLASDVENVRDLASRVDRSHGIVGSFRGVSTLNVLEDGLAPQTSAKAAQRP